MWALLMVAAPAFMAPSATLPPLQTRTSRLVAAEGKEKELANVLQRNQMALFRGVVQPTNSVSKEKKAAPAKEEKEKEMSIKELLTEYGVIALIFHFTVWISCLTAIFTVLSVGISVDSLPEWLMPEGGEGAAEAGGLAARAAATLGVVELIGPARLALTVAATPTVSTWAREYPVVNDLEAWAERSWDRVMGRED
jgi:hypothetical protein